MSKKYRPIRICSQCEYYSTTVNRCKLGKINPTTIKGGLDAVKHFGPDYICIYAKHWDKIIARMKDGDS